MLKILYSNKEIFNRYNFEKENQNEAGVGQEAGTADRWGRGTEEEKLELEGTERVGAPKTGETKRYGIASYWRKTKGP